MRTMEQIFAGLSPLDSTAISIDFFREEFSKLIREADKNKLRNAMRAHIDILEELYKQM